jgi:hypothetical protein
VQSAQPWSETAAREQGCDLPVQNQTVLALRSGVQATLEPGQRIEAAATSGSGADLSPAPALGKRGYGRANRSHMPA